MRRWMMQQLPLSRLLLLFIPVHVTPTEDGTAATAPAPAPAPMPALSPVTVDSSHVVIPGDLQDYLAHELQPSAAVEAPVKVVGAPRA